MIEDMDKEEAHEEIVPPKPKGISLEKAPATPNSHQTSNFFANIIRVERRVTALVRLITISAVTLLIIALSIYITLELRSKDFQLSSFEVPEEFDKNGYKSSVVLNKIMLRIDEMKKTTRSSYSENRKYQDKEVGKEINVEVVGVGVSLKSIIEQLRQILGIERNTISGFVTKTDKSIALTMRIGNKGSETFEMSLDSMSQYDGLEHLITQASELVLQHTDPIVMLNYYFQTQKKGRNIDLAKYLLVNEPQYAKWAYLSWASGLRLEKQNDEAIEMLQRAIEVDSMFSDAWNSWGSVLRNQKKYDEAIEKYEKAIRSNPDYLLPYNNVAFIHFLKGEYDIAIQKSKAIIDKNPDFGYPYSILAQCYAKQQQEELFYKNLEIALKYKVPVWTWLNSDPWKDYVGQERFDRLIAKYRLD
jgi:tetratricopeptide (TPR) repeat protein